MEDAKDTNHTIRVLIEREGDLWVAQCIEQDLATQAPTLDELHYEIQLMLIAHITSCEERGVEPFKLRPAPKEVREKFERTLTAVTARISLVAQGQHLKHPLPRPESRIAA